MCRMNKRIGLHRLIERITTNAMIEATCSCRPACDRKRGPLMTYEMPGYRIKQLNPDEREALSHAKASDFSWRGFK